MKTIILEVEDDTYKTIVEFIKLLPENRCRVLDDDSLSVDERKVLQSRIAQIQQGDYSEFEDWETVKTHL